MTVRTQYRIVQFQSAVWLFRRTVPGFDDLELAHILLDRLVSENPTGIFGIQSRQVDLGEWREL